MTIGNGASESNRLYTPQSIVSRSPHQKYIGARELAEYVYCPRAWWYSSRGVAGPRSETGSAESSLVAGRRFHEVTEVRHVREQYASRAPYAAVAIAGMLALGGLLLWWFHWLRF